MRLKQLDVLRGVAILLVLVHHATDPGGGLPIVFAVPLRLCHRSGWAGVDLFFVLSGFLVSGLLFREFIETGSVGAGRFLVRRGLKIYPAFYAFLISSVLVKLAVGHPLAGSNVLSEAFFLQSYLPGMQGHTWSLAVEEHFYLTLVSLIVLLTRLRRGARDPMRSIVVVFPIVAVTVLALRIHARWTHPIYAQAVHLYPTHLRIDSLFFGVLLSYLFHFRREWLECFVARRQWLVFAAVVMLLAPVALVPIGRGAFIQTVGFSCAYLGFGGLLLLSLFSRTELPRWTLPMTSALATIGFYSYSIYLWHRTIGAIIPWHALGGAGATEASLYLGTSILTGILMARLIELPLLRVRDGRFPARSRSLEGIATQPPRLAQPADAGLALS